jgi:hypothetical protein
MNEKDDTKAQLASRKRSYHSPTLFAYGDVNRLTHARSVFSTKPLDGKVIVIGPFTIQWRS